MFEKITYQNIRAHVERHKFAYGVAVGVVITGTVAVVLGRSHIKHVRLMSAEIKMRPISVLSKQNVLAVVYKGGPGHPGFPVWCIETGEGFVNQAAAARSANISNGIMSKHLNGVLPHVRDLHYERLSI